MLETYAERYREELLHAVVPFWLRHAPDTDFGGLFSCLDREGRVYDPRKYVCQQGRFLWSFSKLYNEMEHRPEWLAAATSSLEFLLRNARDSGGRYYFSLTREGLPVFFQRKPYVAVFVTLGLLEYARATGEKRLQETAVDLFWRIRSWIEYPGMLGRPRLEGEPPASKLAEVLALGRMALALYRALEDRRYYRIMRETVEAALRHHDPERHLLVETVAPNGAKRYQDPDGRLVCPGRSIEGVSLLHELLEQLPDAGRQDLLWEILRGSLEFGWDREFGGLYLFRDAEGKPPLPLAAGMKLWWPHAEALQAIVLAYTSTGKPEWLDWLKRVDEYTFAHFPDPAHGGWFGYCDRRGQLTNTAKGTPYKGMDLVVRALLGAVQRLAGTRAGPGPDIQYWKAVAP